MINLDGLILIPAFSIAGFAKFLQKYLSDNDLSQVDIFGYSMGGFGTFNLAAKYPNVFAAAVPLCGGGDPKKAADLKPVPMWVFHGDKDDMVPVERSRAIVKAIQDIGGEKIKYTELAGEGHGITGIVYSKPELHTWMFEQTRAAEAK